MEYHSKVLEQAVKAISSLPSIGRKSALRLVLHLIQDDTHKSDMIIRALESLKSDLHHCTKCHNLSDTPICSICTSQSRDTTTICVVETVRDLMAIEETGQFRGTYHVLGGVISPIDGIGPDELNLESLSQRVTQEGITELIMAIPPTIEGETTIYYITRQLEHTGVTISTIARGVSFGGDLEYADELTLGRSIVSRIPYEMQR